MEIAAYKAIRANAPNTPVLLFTYAVFGGTGGANAAMTDIHAFNTTVFGNAERRFGPTRPSRSTATTDGREPQPLCRHCSATAIPAS